jgi:hypothetical protein
MRIENGIASLAPRDGTRPDPERQEPVLCSFAACGAGAVQSGQMTCKFADPPADTSTGAATARAASEAGLVTLNP